jgi:TDG/mug DNA glycosylase family protein
VKHRTKALPDVGGMGLAVLFCGINPSLYSAEVGHHFARPGNRFWVVLHDAGFTPRLLSPFEDGLLPSFGLGVTNLVARPTKAAAELTSAEMRSGAVALEELVEEWQPGVLAIVGLGAWRSGFRHPTATVGLQPETVAGRPVWVLPNPSGLNAHYQRPALARLYRELRTFAPFDYSA